MNIVGIGSPCTDILSVVNKLPKPDSGAGIIDFSRQGGGNVATAIVAAARLGAETGFIGLAGTCLNGKFMREDFEYNNVDISRSITVDGAYSAFSIVLSDLETRSRSIIYQGGNLRRLEVGDLDRDYLTSADFLHLEGCGEAEKTASMWVREAGKKVVFDSSNFSERVKGFLPHIDIFIAAEHYYRGDFGTDPDYEKNCRLVAESGPETVIFTLGEKGCVGFSKSEGFFMEDGLKVNVVDTVGAGDVYHGAFLFGLTKGWKIRDIAKFSNAVSAVKIGYIGGRAGIPTFEIVDKFMKTGIIDDAELKQREEYYRKKWLFG